VNNIREVLRPDSVAAAWTARQENPSASRYLAGGIDLTLFSPAGVTCAIDLAGLGLSAIGRTDGKLAIGATATLTQIRESEAVAEFADGFLCDVLGKVASPLQRNLATIGGTIASAHPWSDVVPALLVLDAQLVMYDGMERSVPIHEYLADRGQAAVPLIVAVQIPQPGNEVRAAYETFARTAFDVGMLNCACALETVDGVCHAARIAVGGTPALAQRVAAAEGALVGQPLNPERIHAAALAAREAVAVRDDIRATAAYRRRLVPVIVTRCLQRIAAARRKDER